MQWCATAVQQREAIATKLKGTKMQHFSENKAFVHDKQLGADA
jgi:hypothetical protein